MKLGRWLLAALFYIFLANSSYSQGCSDAGFCTMGSSKPSGVADSLYRQHFRFTLSYGAGEQGVTVVQAIPELELSFFKNNSIQLKLPFNTITGNLGDNNGVGDVAVSITQRFVRNESTSFSFSAGTKLPTGSTDEASGNTSSLPMPYQTGLGTTDLVVGAAWNYRTWNVSAGYQTVLNHDNKNTFLRSRYPGDTDAAGYFESNLLERGDDALLRIERRFHIKKFMITPGLLGIYRLTEDKITDDTGTQEAVKGSDGLTLNITTTAAYAVSNRFDLQLMFGAPALVRDVRPDGLTRSLVLNLGFRYNFNFSN